MNNNYLCELTSRTRKASQASQSHGNLGLTMVRQSAIIWLGKEKETHDSGSSQAIHLQSGMDSTRKRERSREALSLCSSQGKEEQKSRMEIHCSNLEGGGFDGRTGPRKAGPSGKIKNKASTTGWPATIKVILVVARSLRREPGKLMRDGPRYLIPTFSITLPNKSCQWLHKKGYAVEREYIHE